MSIVWLLLIKYILLFLMFLVLFLLLIPIYLNSYTLLDKNVSNSNLKNLFYSSNFYKIIVCNYF